VCETGDHGSFNSWGRDRYWGSTGRVTKLINDAIPIKKLAFADAMKPVVLRHNRWRCDYGFDVDLDDGSTNYEITENLMLGRGLKLREGLRRIVRNNILLNNSLHPHCWLPDSEDVFTQNIVMRAYSPAAMQTDLWGNPEDHAKWGREVDHNLFTSSEADRSRFTANGCDAHSLVGDPMFIDPSKGDFRVREGSPALALGFKNFPMDGFGVTSPRLKRVVRSPDFPPIEKAPRVAANSNNSREWRGARVREMGEMEFSALQVSESEKGVIVADCPSTCPAYLLGLRAGDFIKTIDGRPVRNLEDFFKATNALSSSPHRRFLLRRERKEMTVEMSY